MLHGSQQLCLGLMVLSAQFLRKRESFTYIHRSRGVCAKCLYLKSWPLFYFIQSNRQAYSSCQCHESTAKIMLKSWPRIDSFQFFSNKEIRSSLSHSDLQLSTQFSVPPSFSCPSPVHFPITIVITTFHQGEKSTICLQYELETCFTPLNEQSKSTQNFMGCHNCFMDRANGGGWQSYKGLSRSANGMHVAKFLKSYKKNLIRFLWKIFDRRKLEH